VRAASRGCANAYKDLQALIAIWHDELSPEDTMTVFPARSTEILEQPFTGRRCSHRNREGKQGRWAERREELQGKFLRAKHDGVPEGKFLHEGRYHRDQRGVMTDSRKRYNQYNRWPIR